MNENKITCDICRDLIPLVNDGVASEDSANAVKLHAEGCRECAALLEGSSVPVTAPPESPKALKRVRKWLNRVYIVIMALGIFVGCALTSRADGELLYNCLIMPIAGVFGYFAFRWRAFFTVPIILLFTSFVISLLISETFDIRDVLSWAFIYSIFALVGIIITMLFKFAFAKRNKIGSGKEEVSK